MPSEDAGRWMRCVWKLCALFTTAKLCLRAINFSIRQCERQLSHYGFSGVDAPLGTAAEMRDKNFRIINKLICGFVFLAERNSAKFSLIRRRWRLALGHQIIGVHRTTKPIPQFHPKSQLEEWTKLIREMKLAWPRERGPCDPFSMSESMALDFIGFQFKLQWMNENEVLWQTRFPHPTKCI